MKNDREKKILIANCFLFVFIGLYVTLAQNKINLNQKMKLPHSESKVITKKQITKKTTTIFNPTNLVALQVNTNLVNLTWTDSALEDGYIVQRKPNAGLYTQIGTVRANVTTFNDVAPYLNPNDFIPADRFSAVKLTSNIKFADVTNYLGKATALNLDVYEPSNDNTQARPVIIWIHGGGFRTGSSKTQSYIVNYSNRFAKRGYVCISIDYRLRAGSSMPTQSSEFPALQDAARDANAAINWVKANAATYRIDPNLIFVAGGSAGGRTTQTVCQFDGPDPTAMYVPENQYENTPWDKTGLIANATLWGGLEPEMRGWVYPSPPHSTANYLQSTDVPTIMVHGSADTTILPKESQELNTALTAAGVTTELRIIPGATHSCLGEEATISEWVAAFFAKEWNKVNAKINSFTYRVLAYSTNANSYSNEASVAYSNTLDTADFSNTNDILFYPNPTDSTNININIKDFNLIKQFEVTIYTLDGKLLFSKKYKLTENIKIEPNNKLEKGVYLICFKSEKTTITKKLIIN
jgi:acetyl esterase/lipase